MAARLPALNAFLSVRTTILGSKPSIADVFAFKLLAPVVSKWSPDERTGEQGNHHIVRFVDFVQNAPVYGPLAVSAGDKVEIDPSDVKVAVKPVDMKAEREKKKREKEAAAAGAQGKPDLKEKAKDKVAAVGDKLAATTLGPGAQGEGKPKKEKKEKVKKPQPPPPVEKPLSPALIDLRVGHILRAINHPNADTLYVSTIACGDPEDTPNTTKDEETGKIVRTVCSGLNGLIPLAEMQGRKVVVVCNLKPVTMRGIKSCAMVLAASPKVAEGGDAHAGPVELVAPPADAEAGERCSFEGWEGAPEPVLNPKKKMWEAVQPGFTTTDALEVGFDVAATDSEAMKGQGKSGVAKLTCGKGVCKVTTLKGAVVR
ncbi:nucleic acid-binding protein [Eremomyces bilateralis CBS 781.70]|uniref:Nucleic acid-binding protein n=1 Tax=Eremomyces bilateralis CBS 781.70 TaxID=1392243 RepID=A0A6G1FXT0_9PEZI|nr:nucleic acid-binding protein [Eremomyces bilateralis CBS 781.70]KAF1810476.1 nucleic acid-binding protein [Eremomyces bilateralis CBS 781.70]